MTAYFGDCRAVMRELVSDGVKVQACVTSPPYFGLRDYKVDGQLGLEDTPEQYIENMVGVFDLVRELMADDGTLWIVIGDSYANDSKWGGHTGGKHASVLHNSPIGRNKRYTGLKPKDLIGIPWMLAFALRASGWYLRQDIIWHKPSPMPESVTDRCTKAHEYVFLLSKSHRYYFDAQAISEPSGGWNGSRFDDGKNAINHPKVGTNRSGNHERKPRPGAPASSLKRQAGSVPWEGDTRNKRSVWTVSAQRFDDAHFATYPEALIEPMILSGSRPGDIVLDPFLGSGTTGEVCENLGRKWIGIDINQDYERFQKQRTAQMGLVLQNCGV